ncbi:hypothetical protein BJX99DRAFT_82484 [Aspergillus californicus]
MFYSFKPPRSGSLPKRGRVRQACDYCRRYRVRCDGKLPCSQCATNKIRCIKPSQRGPQPPTVCRAQQLRPSVLPDTPPPSQTQSPQQTPPASTPATVATVANGVDSFTSFVSRINRFCSTVLHISADSAPSSVSSGASSLQTAEQRFPDINPANLRALQNTLLDIFWSRYHSFIPIVIRDDLADPDPGGKVESLRLALLAYSLQSVYHAGLHDRLLGVRMADLSSTHQSLKTLSETWFHKALATTGTYLSYAEPALTDVQRHIFMAVFMLDAGEFQAAYNVTGAAIRLAQCLNLHLPQEREPCGRVWGMLVHLDFRCSRHLGRPMGVSSRETLTILDSVSCPPSASPELAFYSTSVLLTVTAKRVAESLAGLRVDTCIDPNEQIDQRAESLSQHIHPLYQCRDFIMTTTPYSNLTLTCKSYHPHTRAGYDIPARNNNSWMYDQPPIRILQQTLLELQYHDAAIWLHWSFIQFPSRGLAPQRSPRADIHAATALQHALTVTEMVHSRMLVHDALYGSSEIYQYVWNAVLTLIGFMLAYPLCLYAPTARKHVELSLQVFESASTFNPISSHAARLTRSLLGRADALIRLLVSEPSGDSHCSPAGGPDVENPDLGSLDKAPTDDPLLMGSEFDDLWAWAGTVDSETWDGYCHEISDMLLDLPEIPPGANATF